MFLRVLTLTDFLQDADRLAGEINSPKPTAVADYLDHWDRDSAVDRAELRRRIRELATELQSYRERAVAFEIPGIAERITYLQAHDLQRLVKSLRGTANRLEEDRLADPWWNGEFRSRELDLLLGRY